MVQSGPGSENAFGGVAQAFSDSVPILMLPGGVACRTHGIPTHFEAVPNYGGITKWGRSSQLPGPNPSHDAPCLSLLRTGHPAPVMLEIPTDVASEDIDDGFDYRPPEKIKPAGNPTDIEASVKALLAAESPILHAGQGVLYADGTDELIEFAELVGVPVMTTMAGKSVFPENHPLALGASGHTGTGMVKHFLAKADLVFGLGCGLSQSVMSTPIADGKVLVHNSIDELDINKDYAADYAIIGDAKIVLGQLIDEARKQLGGDKRNSDEVVGEIKTVKEQWLAEWMPKLTSDEIPINPYRVVWDLMQAVDRTQTIVTHDSGNPRDQTLPFYETITPHGYIGWGKSTQLDMDLD